MAETKKDKKFWIGRVLLVILLILAAWTYYQLDINFRQLESSNQNFQDITARQALTVQKYAAEVIAAKKELMAAQLQVAETEKIVAQLKTENSALQEKVKLLDKMAELEANIADLKSKNNALLEEIARLEKDALLHPERIKSLDEGRTAMSKFRQRVKGLDRRMHEIKRDMLAAKIDAQKELDKKRSLAGNNGYLTRNGMLMPQDIILTTENANIKVDVKFVK